jgi:hypothetical protein
MFGAIEERELIHLNIQIVRFQELLQNRLRFRLTAIRRYGDSVYLDQHLQELNNLILERAQHSLGGPS